MRHPYPGPSPGPSPGPGPGSQTEKQVLLQIIMEKAVVQSLIFTWMPAGSAIPTICSAQRRRDVSLGELLSARAQMSVTVRYSEQDSICCQVRPTKLVSA